MSHHKQQFDWFRQSKWCYRQVKCKGCTDLFMSAVHTGTGNLSYLRDVIQIHKYTYDIMIKYSAYRSRSTSIKIRYAYIQYHAFNTGTWCQC